MVKTLPKQRGFALITVLLIVSLVTIIASQLVYQQYLDIKRSENMLSQAQALAVANGLETWIKKGLQLDAKMNEIDHLNEEWANPMLPVPFAEGEVGGQLFDLQGRFNLNNLAEKDKTKREAWQKVAHRFFELQKMPKELESVVSDWVDADQEEALTGAEDTFYLLKEPAYRAANQPLVTVDELKLLKDFTPKMVDSLRPLVATLPMTTAININTAPIEVLQSLADWLTAEIAQAWVTQRKQSPAKATADFRTFLVSQTQLEENEINTGIPDHVISVRSDYFMMVGYLSYGVANQQVSGILYRKDKEDVKLVQRWFSSADNE